MLKGFAFLLAVLIFTVTVSSQNASATMYDGTKAAVSITFQHAFSNQIPAIEENMSDMNGTIAVIVQRVGRDDYMTEQQLLDLQDRGFEIASHSQTHAAISDATPPDLLYYETVQSKFDLEQMGLHVSGFVPPHNKLTTASFALLQQYYGWTEFFKPITNSTYDPEYISIEELEYSKEHFGIYNEPIWGVGNDDQLQTFADVKEKIDYAIANKLWVVLKFHGIATTGGTYDTPPEMFEDITEYIRAQKNAGNLIILTRAEGVGLGVTAPTFSHTISNESSCESDPVSGTWSGGNTCTVLSLATNSGDALTINSGIVLVNSGTINNSGVIQNYGTINNLNTINNPGIIYNHCGAVYLGTGPNGNPVIDLACPVNTVISDETSCELEPVNGTWNVDTCTVSSIVINPGDSLTINSGIILTNSGILDNSGNLNNNGTINNFSVIDNAGILINFLNSTLNNADTLNNYDTIVNNGTINNSATIHNFEFNLIENSGILDNILNSTVINDGTITNQGLISNQCDFTYLGDLPIGNLIIDNCVYCTSGSGDWIVNSVCQLSDNKTVSGNVIIENNSMLIIPHGKTLDIDFDQYHLLIKSGSKVIVKSNGTIN